MTDQIPHPDIGGLVARRRNRVDDPAEFVAHGPTHRVESIIAASVVTKCGRRMQDKAADGLTLVYWPQGARHLPTCRGGCR